MPRWWSRPVHRRPEPFRDHAAEADARRSPRPGHPSRDPLHPRGRASLRRRRGSPPVVRGRAHVLPDVARPRHRRVAPRRGRGPDRSLRPLGGAARLLSPVRVEVREAALRRQVGLPLEHGPRPPAAAGGEVRPHRAGRPGRGGVDSRPVVGPDHDPRGRALVGVRDRVGAPPVQTALPSTSRCATRTWSWMPRRSCAACARSWSCPGNPRCSSTTAQPRRGSPS